MHSIRNYDPEVYLAGDDEVADSVLERARQYVRAGISVIPIRRDGSKAPDPVNLPRIWNDDTSKSKTSWKPFTQRCPTDEELQKWFGGGKPAGIGVITGAVSGALELLDFDAEARDIFPKWWALVNHEAPGLVERLSIVQTPREPDGGVHVRYRCPDVKIPGNMKLATDPAAPPKDRTLIETRGEGGYAVAPGSPADCHATGRPYEYLTETIIPPSITTEERELLIRCARYFDKQVVIEDAAERNGQSRDDGLKPGEDFDRRGPDWKDILTPHGWVQAGRALNGERRWRRPDKREGWSATTGHCRGQDGADLLRVFSSNAPPFEAGKCYGKFRAYALLNHDGDLAAAVRDLARHGYGRPRTDPPVPLAYQTFPVEVLPAPLAAFVRQGAAALGCDASYFALPVLTVAASLIGNSRVIQLKRDWTEPAVLWAAIISDSGTLKSPAQRLAVAPVYEMQRELLDEYARRKAEFAKAKARREEKIKEAKKDGKPPDDLLPDQPAPGRILTGDTTLEKLGSLLADNPRGILVCRDELRSWFASFTRYKGGNESDLPAWLEFFRAESVIVDRKTGDRPTLLIPRAAVSVCGGIQPGTLARTLKPESYECGLAARLLMAMPPKQLKRWTEAEIDPETRQRYKTLLRQLQKLKPDEDAQGEPEPLVLKLTPEAKQAWIDFYQEWAAKQADAEGEQAACLSKLEAYAARFALIHHVVTRVDAGADDCDPIDRASIEAGATLVRWFAYEAERVYGVCRSTDEERRASRLIEYIRQCGGEVTARTLHKANRSRYPSPEAAESALEALVEAGLGEWLPTGGGGRPSRKFCVRDYTPHPESPESSESPSDEREDAVPISTPKVTSKGSPPREKRGKSNTFGANGVRGKDANRKIEPMEPPPGRVKE